VGLRPNVSGRGLVQPSKVDILNINLGYKIRTEPLTHIGRSIQCSAASCFPIPERAELLNVGRKEVDVAFTVATRTLPPVVRADKWRKAHRDRHPKAGQGYKVPLGTRQPSMSWLTTTSLSLTNMQAGLWQLLRIWPAPRRSSIEYATASRGRFVFASA
jgi:hypothetical protein